MAETERMDMAVTGELQSLTSHTYSFIKQFLSASKNNCLCSPMQASTP